MSSSGSDLSAVRPLDRRLSAAIGVVVLLAATAVAYVPAMRGGFIWDDDYYVTENLPLRSAEGLARIWTDPTSEPQYYPLVHTTFWVEYQLWGQRALGYHVVNVVLHGLSTLLLWRLLVMLGLPTWVSWVATAVFALHPVHVESVAWITERKNVLSELFYLSAAWAYLKFARIDEPDIGTGGSRRAGTSGTRGSWRWYALATVLFICALLSKTVTASLPAALLLVIWWKRGRINWRHVATLVPLLIVGAAMGIFTAHLEKYQVGTELIKDELALSWMDRILVAGRAVWFYAGKLVWPRPLMFIYERWNVDASVWWQWVFPVAAGVIIVALVLLYRRIGRGPVTAALFFGGTLFPALGFADVYPFRFSFVADHFQYLASIGLIVLGTVAAARVLHGLRATKVIAAAAVLGALGWLTWQQGYIYNNSETLWRDTLAKNPGCWMAHNNLGRELMRSRKADLGQRAADHAEAIEQFQQTLRLKSDDVVAKLNIGTVMRYQGKTDEAIEYFQQLVDHGLDDSRVHASLAILLLNRGDLAGAKRSADNAMASQPYDPGTIHTYGRVLLTDGQADRAAPYLSEAVRENPDNAVYHYHLGVAMVQLRRLDEAIEHLSEAARLDDRDHWAVYQLGLTLIGARRVEEGVAALQRAAELDPQSAVIRYALADVQFRLGRREEAVAMAQEAISLAEAQGEAELAEEIRGLIEKAGTVAP